MSIDTEAVLALVKTSPRTFADLCVLLRIRLEDRRELEKVVQRMRKKGLVRFDKGLWVPSSKAADKPKSLADTIRRDELLKMVGSLFQAVPRCWKCPNAATVRTVNTLFPEDVQHACDEHPFSDLYRVEPVPHQRAVRRAAELFP